MARNELNLTVETWYEIDELILTAEEAAGRADSKAQSKAIRILIRDFLATRAAYAHYKNKSYAEDLFSELISEVEKLQECIKVVTDGKNPNSERQRKARMALAMRNAGLELLIRKNREILGARDD